VANGIGAAKGKPAEVISTKKIRSIGISRTEDRSLGQKENLCTPEYKVNSHFQLLRKHPKVKNIHKDLLNISQKKRDEDCLNAKRH
jgi:hypothetical protein